MRYFCIISWSFLPSSHYFYKYAELGFFHDYFCPFSSTGEIIYLLFKVVPSWRGKEVIGVCDTSKCEQKGMNKIWKNMFNKPYNSMLKKKKTGKSMFCIARYGKRKLHKNHLFLQKCKKEHKFSHEVHQNQYLQCRGKKILKVYQRL